MYDTEDTPLPSPVTTRVLRLQVLTWSPQDDQVCLDMEALGCLAEPRELGGPTEPREFGRATC